MSKDRKKQIVDRFVLKMDELNIVSQNTIQSGVNMFEDTLIDAYIEGFSAAAYMLGEDGESVNIEKDIDIKTANVEAAIKKKYQDVSIYTKAEGYIKTNDAEGLQRLLESEYHRVYNQAILDYARQTGKNVYKTWVAVMDDKTRETHFYLDGTRVPLDAYFYSFDGDKGMFPGTFERAENNANCRCIITLSNGNI